jgi:hypothetical protein
MLDGVNGRQELPVATKPSRADSAASWSEEKRTRNRCYAIGSTSKPIAVGP